MSTLPIANEYIDGLELIANTRRLIVESMLDRGLGYFHPEVCEARLLRDRASQDLYEARKHQQRTGWRGCPECGGMASYFGYECGHCGR